MPLREQSLITRVRRAVRPNAAVWAGIGDDCAVLRVPPRHQMLVTTDFSLEGVHFRRDWHTPAVIGHRCMTRGLSDIAAMGGEPLAAFLSLALPRNTLQSWVDRFLEGLLALAKECNVVLAGGDTAQSPVGIQADIVVVGSVPNGAAILRSGARPGDYVYVTGDLGGSGAAIAALAAGAPVGSGHGRIRPQDYLQHFHPMPRIAVGQLLRQRGLAAAMIDISDGLSTDLDHICQESGVGAVIEAGAIPLAQVGRPVRKVLLHQALHGGEDYELMFTSAKKVPAVLGGVPVTHIGHITRERGMHLVLAGGRQEKLTARGWEHFRGRAASKG